MAFSPKSLGADEAITRDRQDPLPQHWGILYGLDFRMRDAVQLAIEPYNRARATHSPLTYLCPGSIHILHPYCPHLPRFIY
jgi:hypothetical protein